jgi:hypothetical protein
MEKREAELKQQFTVAMKQELPTFLMLQYASAGAPDREIVGAGKTTRWEFKHATPSFSSPGLQELTCARLDAVSHCRYVIWLETAAQLRTIIIPPMLLWKRHEAGDSGDPDARLLEPESWCEGFDMTWLVDQVRMAHGF